MSEPSIESSKTAGAGTKCSESSHDPSGKATHSCHASRLIEKPGCRDFHGFSPGNLRQRGRQIRRNAPLAHAGHSIGRNLPEPAANLHPWAGIRGRDELHAIGLQARIVQMKPFAGANGDRKPVLSSRQARVIGDGFEKRGNAVSVEIQAENFLWEPPFRGQARQFRRSSAGEIPSPEETARVAASLPRPSASRQLSGSKICHGTAAAATTIGFSQLAGVSRFSQPRPPTPPPRHERKPLRTIGFPGMSSGFQDRVADFTETLTRIGRFPPRTMPCQPFWPDFASVTAPPSKSDFPSLNALHDAAARNVSSVQTMPGNHSRFPPLPQGSLTEDRIPRFRYQLSIKPFH